MHVAQYLWSILGPWEAQAQGGLDDADPRDLHQLGLGSQVCWNRISSDSFAHNQPCPRTSGSLLACNGNLVPPLAQASQRNTFCGWESMCRLQHCCAHHSPVGSWFPSRKYGCIARLVVTSPLSSRCSQPPHATGRRRRTAWRGRRPPRSRGRRR